MKGNKVGKKKENIKKQREKERYSKCKISNQVNTIYYISLA